MLACCNVVDYNDGRPDLLIVRNEGVELCCTLHGMDGSCKRRDEDDEGWRRPADVMAQDEDEACQARLPCPSKHLLRPAIPAC